MNCSDVQESLSAYFDGELPDELRVQVSSHLVECPECAQSLAAFGRLSTMAAAVDTPAPPDQIWTQIERQLEEPTVHKVAKQPAWSIPKYLVMAATVLIAVGIGWIAFGPWFGHGEHEAFAAEFGHYLEEFGRDPDAAQQFLMAKYNAQAVTAEQALQRVGYRPAVADGVPDGYSVESIYVMSMPCCANMQKCTCVQTVCRRGDGSAITIFEHGEDKPEWFGNRPTTAAQCGGKTCSLVEIDDRIAASWNRGNRHITVIGARDVEEVDQLAAALN